MSRLPGNRARPVLRGPRRSNAPGLPDEIWNGIITRQLIRRGTHTSVKVLNADIRQFVANWNSYCKPVTWKVTADKIIEKVRLVTAQLDRLLGATEIGDVVMEAA